MPEQDWVRVEGARKIALVAQALRHLGTDRTIVTRMSTRIRRSGAIIRTLVRASAEATLPRRGGLNTWISAAKFRIAVLRGQRSAGVRLTVGRDSLHGRSDLQAIDAGTVRHPLWGSRRHWYPQVVTPGFATRVVDGPGLDAFRADTLDAIDDAVREALDAIG